MRLVDYDADETYLLDGKYKVNAYKVEHTVDGVPVGFLAEPNDNSKELVAVVRCKDCKWYRCHNKQCVKNGHHGTKLDDYCSYGERKEKGKC